MSKLKLFLLSLSFILAIPFLGLAEDTLTITTYYPSPYGVYREMRSQRLAIGDNYIDNPDYTWEEENGDGGEIDYLADLVVEGNVGIGTTNPWQKLTLGASLASSYISILQDATHNTNLGWIYNVTPANGYGNWNTYGYTNPIRIDASNIQLNSQSGGNVGIGTTGPSYKLDVAGTIRAQGTVIYSCPVVNNGTLNVNCHGQLQTAPTCTYDTPGCNLCGSSACTPVGHLVN
ncbi:MAG: hypothetical protein PHE30_04715 [Candidatus Omnitrophica bacterium]|jgi:hypothetical protein|nr:hypothetical protein [Candidatus Omnitrophota bacterium]MDD5027736.1 hypothetical protein [Candidatus Omnitrophota bacterium]MDD5662549.1 hypothetical protein [Candidatus Omnitrophota bacterium]